ncbi:MAG: hypothetical protein ACR2HR_16685 [Euzebya sp.]
MTADLSRPHLDGHTRTALAYAITLLAILRGHIRHDEPVDPADALQLAWSLSLQIDHQLLDMIERAIDHGYHHHDLRDLLTHPQHDR